MSQVTEEESVLTGKEGVEERYRRRKQRGKRALRRRVSGNRGTLRRDAEAGTGCGSASVGTLALGSRCGNAGAGASEGKMVVNWPGQRAQV